MAALESGQQLNILYSLQEAVQMCGCGPCGKMIKLRRCPGMYRVQAGKHRILGHYFCGAFVVTDILLRNERTYRLMR